MNTYYTALNYSIKRKDRRGTWNLLIQLFITVLIIMVHTMIIYSNHLNTVLNLSVCTSIIIRRPFSGINIQCMCDGVCDLIEKCVSSNNIIRIHTNTLAHETARALCKQKASVCSEPAPLARHEKKKSTTSGELAPKHDQPLIYIR